MSVEVVKRSTSVDDLPQFLTPAEVAVYLDKPVWSVYSLVRRGLIEHVTFGRSIRIPKTALLTTPPAAAEASARRAIEVSGSSRRNS